MDGYATATFFVLGGTLSAEAASYVARAADRQLLEALVEGRFCYVLNSRQMGKSSLCVRTMERLKGQGVRPVFVDLTRIGGRNVTPEQWYAGIAVEIGRSLSLRNQVLDFWGEEAHLSPVQRLFASIREVVLAQINGDVVIFFDEIDAARSLPFSADEFFAGIRECYNRRVHDAEYSRLTFCLLGVAVPSDLINSPASTPFNVGERIYLRDFTLDEAAVLAQEFPNRTLFERIFYWTHGHPYLTQSLCAAAAATNLESPEDVDALVKRDLFEPKARETNINLADVANRALHAGDLEPDPERFRADLLSVYERAWKGKPIADDESNRVVALLKMSGIMRSEGNRLEVRNRIYRQVFDRSWVRENMPGQELRRQRRAFWGGVFRTSVVAIGVVALLARVAWTNAQLARMAQRLAAQVSADRDTAEYEVYVSKTNLMSTAYAQGDIEYLQSLLDQTERSPHRGLEWSFWHALVRGAKADVDLATHSTVWGLTFAQDGKSILVLERLVGRNVIERYSLPSLKRDVHRTVPPDAFVFQPGGRLLFVKDSSHQIGKKETRVFDFNTGKRAYTLRCPGRGWRMGTASTGYEADLEAFVSEGGRGVDTFETWSLADGRPIAKQRLVGATITAIPAGMVSDDGKIATLKLARRDSNAVSNQLAIYDARAGRIVLRLPVSKRNVYGAIAPSDRYLAFSDWQESQVTLVDLQKKAVVHTWSLSGASGLQFSTDGRKLLAVGNGTCQVFDTSSYLLVGQVAGSSGSLSPDGRTIAVPGLTVKLVDIGRPVLAHHNYHGVDCMWGAPNNRVIVYVPPKLRFLDGTDLREFRPPVPITEGFIRPAANGLFRFQPVGKDLSLHDMITDRELFRVKNSLGWVWFDCNSQSGPVFFATLMRDVTLYDPRRRGSAWSAHFDVDISGLCLTRDSRVAAVALQSGKVLFYNAANGKLLRTAQMSAIRSHSQMSFSPDGSLLMVDGSTYGWVVRSRDGFAYPLEDAKDVSDVCLDPDGRRVLVGTRAGTVQVFDAASGRRLTTFSTGSQTPCVVTFGLDRRNMYIANGDGITVWPLATRTP